MEVEINVRAILDRIKKEEGFTSDKEVANLLGIDPTALSHRIRDNSTQIIEYLTYCYTRNKPIEKIIYGEEGYRNGVHDTSRIIPIKVYTVTTPKGKGKSGILVPVEEIGIPRGDYNQHIRAYRHMGDEMGEVIPDGSVVLINTAEVTPIPGEIYLIKYWYAGSADHKRYIHIIRRVEIKKNSGGLVLKPVNPNCDTVELAAESIEDDTIIGRVIVCHGRRYLYKDLVA